MPRPVLCMDITHCLTVLSVGVLGDLGSLAVPEADLEPRAVMCTTSPSFIFLNHVNEYLTELIVLGCYIVIFFELLLI